jgi:adenine deaminase
MSLVSLFYRMAIVVTIASLHPALAAAQAHRLDGERDSQPARATLAIVGGLLIDGHEGPPQPQSIVLIDGNRIVAVGTRDTLTVPAGARVIDAGGMTVMPGLIDAHVHMDIIGHTNYAYWHQTFCLATKRSSRPPRVS